MSGFFILEGIGPAFYMRLLGQRRALRVSPAESWLTVYRRRLVSDLDVTFRFYFLRFIWNGKFILATIIFPRKIM